LPARSRRLALKFGETYKDFYAEFATGLEYQLFFAVQDSKNLEALKEFVAQLRRVALPLISFAVDALRTYLSEHQSKLTVSELTH
jgi:hypothetical protein